MGEERERQVPAVADKPVPTKAESPDQTIARRLQIAAHIAPIVKVRPSRVEVRFLYSKQNQSMYRVHIVGVGRRIISSHFVQVTNPAMAVKGWQAIRDSMSKSPVVLVATPPLAPIADSVS